MYRIALCGGEPSSVRENEAMICRILEARHFQRNAGFSAAGFSTAEAPLASFREEPEAFRLLLPDIRLAWETLPPARWIIS